MKEKILLQKVRKVKCPCVRSMLGHAVHNSPYIEKRRILSGKERSNVERQWGKDGPDIWIRIKREREEQTWLISNGKSHSLLLLLLLFARKYVVVLCLIFFYTRNLILLSLYFLSRAQYPPTCLLPTTLDTGQDMEECPLSFPFFFQKL